VVTGRTVEVQGNVADGDVTYSGKEVAVFVIMLVLVDVTNRAFDG